MTLYRCLPIGLVMIQAGCVGAGAFLEGFADGYARGAAAADGGGTTPVATSPALLTNEFILFGGPGHDTFLGCFSCSEYDSDSIFNRYGTFGSQYSSDSIFNPYGQFGSPYSTYSACNPYASDPPVIVDGSGAFYGRLTINAYNTQGLDDDTIMQWLKVVCSG